MEIVGRFWGTLELLETARVVNISTTGALIESPLPVALHSTEAVHLVVDGEEIAVNAQVRHQRQVIRDGEAPQYLIGLEFLSPPHLLIHSIQQIFSADEPTA
jgi:hypothetical protein